MIQTLERPHTFSMSAMLSVNSPAGCETVCGVTKQKEHRLGGADHRLHYDTTKH